MFDIANLPVELADCEIVVNTKGRRLDREGVLELLAGHVDGVIAGLEPYDAEVLSAAKGLRAISRVGTGTDNVDLEAAERLGIQVLRTPDAPTVAVAELTIAIILSGLRYLNENHQRVMDGTWTGRTGALLAGKSVGLIGAGRISRAVAERLAAFSARVQATDPVVNPSSVNYPLVELDHLLATSDIVSLHLPAQADGPLLDARRLSLMRRGAMLVNTARGGLVDEAAVAHRLQSGDLSFAGLDTFESEPYEGPLQKCPNVLLTPHIGSNTTETRRAMEREAAENLAIALGRKT